MGLLYRLTSPSGKSYIGITMHGIEKRILEHEKRAISTRARGPFHSAIRKYGMQAFVCSSLDESDDWEELCRLERLAIAEHQTLCPLGYNMTIGGDGVPTMCAEAKARHRKHTSIGVLRKWQDPTFRAKHKSTFANAEFKERHAAATSVGTRKAFADPILRARFRAQARSERRRAGASTQMQALWKDPEYRARQVKIRRNRSSARTPESIQAQSDKMRLLIAERKRQGTYWMAKESA